MFTVECAYVVGTLVGAIGVQSWYDLDLTCNRAYTSLITHGVHYFPMLRGTGVSGAILIT